MDRLKQGIDPVLLNEGTPESRLQLANVHADDLSTGEDLPPLEKFAFGRITCPNILLCAAKQLRKEGKTAPGPDGLRLEEMSRAQIAETCRALSQALRDGTYSPSRARRAYIAKPGKTGKRAIFIQNICDRIVAKAAHLILVKIIDPTFVETSFGFRPQRSIAGALATAIGYTAAEDLHTWVSADIENAFEAVPLSRFAVALRARMFPPELEQLILLLAGGESGRGLRQGSPLAPLLFNLFVDFFLDRKWPRLMSGVKLLRYTDDLLLLCKKPEAAVRAREVLSNTLLGAGTPLKKTNDPPYVVMRPGAELTFLGYHLTMADKKLIAIISPRLWGTLTDSLAESHIELDSTFQANDVIRSWLSYLGPCFENEVQQDVLRRVRRLAEDQGFYEIPTDGELLEQWKEASDEWRRLAPDYVEEAYAVSDGLPGPHAFKTVRVVNEANDADEAF